MQAAAALHASGCQITAQQAADLAEHVTKHDTYMQAAALHASDCQITTHHAMSRQIAAYHAPGRQITTQHAIEGEGAGLDRRTGN